MNNKVFVFSRRYAYQWVSFALLEPINVTSLENCLKMGRLVQYISVGYENHYPSIHHPCACKVGENHHMTKF